MNLKLFIFLFVVAFSAYEAHASFNYWFFGSGPGSFRYWQNGTGPGSRTFWLSSTENVPGSRKRWISPTGGEGSARQWYGADSVYPSLRQWSAGDGVGSRRIWNSPDLVTGSRQAWLSKSTKPTLPLLTIILCKAGAISIEPCRYLPDVPNNSSFFSEELYRLQCLGQNDAITNIEEARILNLEELRNRRHSLEQERSDPNVEESRIIRPVRVLPRP